MTQRQITLVNNSTSPTALALLQSSGLAWLAKYAYPGTQVRFTWDDTDLCFVWAGTGQISPGVVLDVSQVVSTSVDGNNVIDLSYDVPNRTFFLHNQRSGGRPGTLTISADQTVPVNAVAVGIGMSGKPTFVAQAQPNMTYSFSPQPIYFLAFGNITQSAVVDADSVKSQKVEFPPNVFALTATLGANNEWTVVPDILVMLQTDE
jgi:hypothetical protein